MREVNKVAYSLTHGSAQFGFSAIIAMRSHGFLIAEVAVHNEDSTAFLHGNVGQGAV